MAMTNEQKYSAVLRELGELLESKNATISSQKWQIDQLKEKLAAAEKELEREMEYHATIIGESIALQNKVSDLQCEIERLKGGAA